MQKEKANARVAKDRKNETKNKHKSKCKIKVKTMMPHERCLVCIFPGDVLRKQILHLPKITCCKLCLAHTS